MAVDCAAEIRKHFADITDADAKDIVKGLKEILAANKAEPQAEQLMRRIAAEHADAAKRHALIREWHSKLTLVAHGKIAKRVASFDDAFQGYQSYIVGSEGYVFGALHSIDAQKKALRGKYLKPMELELERGHKGIKKMFGERNFDHDVGLELEALPKGKRGTANDDAFHVAQVFDKYKEIIRKELNSKGAYRARLPGHTGVQDHDPRLMMKAGFQKWKNVILPELDMEKSFGPAGERANADEVLDIIFKNRTAGKLGVAVTDTGVPTPSGLAGQLSQSRVLHFKDFAAYERYAKHFSRRSLTESAIHRMESDLEDLAVLDRMGPNPEAQHKKWISKVSGQLRRAGDTSMRRKIQRLEADWSAVSGKDRVVGIPDLATYGNALRSLQQWSKLGFSTISSFNDLMTTAATLNYNGIGFMDSYLSVFQGIRAKPTAAQKAILDAIGTYSESMNAQIAGRFTAGDGLPGTSAKISNIFYQVSLLNMWTDMNKNSSSLALSHFLANQLPHALDDLDPRLRNQLNRYGIAETQWKKMQEAAGDLRDIDGQKYLTPDAIEELPRFKGRDDIVQALRMYYLNEADYSVPTPGAKERGFALRGTQPGTPYGEMARAVWQFKMFPLTVMTKIWPRMARQGVPGIAHIALGSIIFGGAAMTAKDLLKGKEMRDFSNPKTWVSAALQGGGASFLGDMIFNDFNQFGRSFPEVVLGPSAGAVGDFARVFSSILRLEGKEAAAKFWRGAVSNAPFANLFYGKAAVDYFMVYLINETLNPGYLKRMERHMEKSSGQGFLIPPSSVIPHGGLRGAL